MTGILLGFVPWWAWLAGALGIVAVTMLGLWPVALAFLRGVPLKAWLVLAAFAAVVGLHFVLEARALAGNDAKWEAKLVDRLAAQKRAFERQIQDARDAAQKKLDALRDDNAKLQRERDAALKAAEARRIEAVANLKKGFAHYVTPLQLSRCSDIPRGFLLFGADAAAYANGGNPPVAPPAPDLALDAPSGVSLDALAGTVAEQAGAFRQCRERVLAWETWARDVDDSFERLKQIFEPKAPAP